MKKWLWVLVLFGMGSGVAVAQEGADVQKGVDAADAEATGVRVEVASELELTKLKLKALRNEKKALKSEIKKAESALKRCSKQDKDCQKEADTLAELNDRFEANGIERHNLRRRVENLSKRTCHGQLEAHTRGAYNGCVEKHKGESNIEEFCREEKERWDAARFRILERRYAKWL